MDILIMHGLKGEERKACYHLALALAKNSKLIWSKVCITDRGFISKKLFSTKIPLYRWMGHLWHYPEFNRVFNQLNEEEKHEVRKQGTGISRELRKTIRNIISP